jgi:DNA-binding MarR family transcriptional regulator
MQERGFPDFSPAWVRLLGNLDVEGARLGPLARRMGVTRQAASQLGAEIERGGYLERVPDPEDRRGAILRFAPRGREALALAIETMIAIEGEYAALVGAEDYAAMKATLARIVAAVDPEGALGLD